MHHVTITHNFETAHRLPQLGGKCANLHGHSWWVTFAVEGNIDQAGIVCDFSALKQQLRDWIDTHLDHGTMLGTNDPLVTPLTDAGCRLYLFGRGAYTDDLPWPTVENTATLLRRVTTVLLPPLGEGLRVTRVVVTETHVNAAEVTA